MKSCWGIILFGRKYAGGGIYRAIARGLLVNITAIAFDNLLLTVFTYTRTIRGVDCDLSLREQQLFRVIVIHNHYLATIPR